MHELSVTEGLLQIVTDEVKERNVGKVCAITLVIGDLTSIVDDSLQFYFDILSKGSVADGAALVIKRIVPEFRCRDCGFGFRRKDRSYSCQACGSREVDVTAGQEFYIESIEVETDED